MVPSGLGLRKVRAQGGIMGGCPGQRLWYENLARSSPMGRRIHHRSLRDGVSEYLFSKLQSALALALALAIAMWCLVMVVVVVVECGRDVRSWRVVCLEYCVLGGRQEARPG